MCRRHMFRDPILVPTRNGEKEMWNKTIAEEEEKITGQKIDTDKIADDKKAEENNEEDK
ncbi:hypothetical protein ACFLQT_00625 [Bacteroidota bacterium]